MKARSVIKHLVEGLPYIRNLKKRIDDLEDKLDDIENKLLVPPGHFYSPITSREELDRLKNSIYGTTPEQLPGIDLNTERQLDLLNRLRKYYEQIPFTGDAGGENRYYFENDHYSYSDGVFLFLMLMHLNPAGMKAILSEHF